jgi:hypothetical protein
MLGRVQAGTDENAEKSDGMGRSATGEGRMMVHLKVRDEGRWISRGMWKRE